MRVDEVTAVAFGPFRGSTLRLTPGMNVVHGPNEAGKSSWFAATYSGLAGRRKARGRGTLAQAEFRSRHKPWSGSLWKVELTLTLDDGLALRVEQDLARGEHRVVDSETGRPITTAELSRRLGVELFTEATLDVTRILGLNRDSARATVFTGQADVLRVVEDAGELQELLERAATTDAVDATADGALAWLADLRSAAVGSEHVGNKPLRAARRAVEEAREASATRRDHLGRLVDSLAAAQRLRPDLDRAAAELEEIAEVGRWHDLRVLRADIQLTEELEREIASQDAIGSSFDEARSQEAVRVLAMYESGTDVPPPLEGATVAELEQELAALPDTPSGDLEPRAAVTAARDRAFGGLTALRTHVTNGPSPSPPPDDDGLDPEELRRLASALEELPPTAPTGVAEALAVAEQRERDTHAAHLAASAAYATTRASNEQAVLAHEQDLAHFREALSEHERLVAAEADRYAGLLADYEAAKDRYAAEHASYALTQERHAAERERQATERERFAADQRWHAMLLEQQAAEQGRHQAALARYQLEVDHHTEAEQRYEREQEAYVAEQARRAADEERYVAEVASHRAAGARSSVELAEHSARTRRAAKLRAAGVGSGLVLLALGVVLAVAGVPASGLAGIIAGTLVGIGAAAGFRPPAAPSGEPGEPPEQPAFAEPLVAPVPPVPPEPPAPLEAQTPQPAPLPPDLPELPDLPAAPVPPAPPAAPVSPKPPVAPEPPRLDDSTPPAPPQPDEALAAMRAQLVNHDSAVVEYRRRLNATHDRLAELRIEGGPEELRMRARRIDDAADADRRRRAHEARGTELRDALSAALAELEQQLSIAGVPAGRTEDGPVDTESEAERLEKLSGTYVAECRRRAELATAAAAREGLVSALEQRRRLDDERARVLAERAAQTELLLRTATAVAPDYEEGSGATAAVTAVRDWLAQQQAAREALSERDQLIARRNQLLDGATLDEWREAEAVDALAAGPEPAEITGDVEHTRAVAEERQQALLSRAAQLEGQVAELHRELQPVAETIEEEAAAARDLAEVETLQRCLEEAIRQLDGARARAHATIAPALEAQVRPFLPMITDGRYLDVRVNPSDLSVDVAEASGGVREARLLSQGTMEQIFLLLRLALTQVLSSTSEPAPLFLDDVTVQSDAGRTRAILSMLHQVSHQHQVVVFTQEHDVVEWAQQELRDERDQVVYLHAAGS